MRIPSGDLAPARKHRRYGRRRRSRWPAVLVVLVLAGAAAGGYAYTQRDSDDTSESVAQPSPCPSPAPSVPRKTATKPVAVVLPAAGKVQFRLLNGTGRDGLARTVGDELARRGFHVLATINAPKPLAGASRVTFGPGARNAATLVHVHVLGSQLIPVPSAPRGAVEVTLGSSFIRLRNAAEVHAMASALAHPVTPVVKPQPTPSRICG